MRVLSNLSLVCGIGILAVIGGCDNPHTVRVAPVNEKPVGAVIQLPVPLGLPPIPIPSHNPQTAETIALGRKLFYEKKLSGDSSIACASCHNPRLGFADGRKFSLGVAGQIGFRNAPTVLNASYSSTYFWDGRARSLEEQAGGPITNPVEMNEQHDVCVSKLEADVEYRADFEKAFGPGAITMRKVESAIASFERSLLSGNSAFDRYEFGGDKKALSPAAIRGLAIFRDSAKGNCVTCHTIEKAYALFADGKFHNIGVGVDGEGNLTDLGRYSQTKVEFDRGSFKTPTLRNVALSAPYMHDGTMKTLKEVVDYYAGGANSNANLDMEIKKITLSGKERSDLVEFLESLTGEMPVSGGPPEQVPSR